MLEIKRNSVMVVSLFQPKQDLSLVCGAHGRERVGCTQALFLYFSNLSSDL